MLAAAAVLSCLLIATVTLLYPHGTVTSRPARNHVLCLVLLPPITAAPDSEMTGRIRRPPSVPSQPAPALLRRLLLGQSVAPAVTVTPDTVPPVPPPFLRPAPLSLLGRAAADTARRAALWRLSRWERGGRDSLRWLGLMEFHARRAASFSANERSIFDEDWLAAQPLVEPPRPRRTPPDSVPIP